MYIYILYMYVYIYIMYMVTPPKIYLFQTFVMVFDIYIYS